ncbi:SRPBCC family protein [Marinobacter sp. LN3S78]|uniref:SRPBCC family protein n=1 Tax=Marinobacter sp. LN3S78 TaxID=3382300 RepID=UPI00387A90FB
MPDVQHISTYIHRAPEDVYAFASNPENLPRWAAGLASSEVKRDEGVWVAEAPFGKVKIRFVEENTLGVMDHDVELDSGVVVHNPMRVVPNAEGSEFIFTLLRQPGMSDAQFAEDARSVEKDLQTLKELLESTAE